MRQNDANNFVHGKSKSGVYFYYGGPGGNCN